MGSSFPPLVFKSKIVAAKLHCLFQKMPHIQKYVQEQSSLDYTNASKSGDFWGSCYNMNGIIKYSFSQRKRENDLAPH